MTAASQKGSFTPHREVEELSLLLDISRSLETTLGLREVLGPVLEQMSARLGLRRGMLCLLDPQNEAISIELSTGLTELQQKRGLWRFGEGITGEVIRSGEPCLIPRVSQDPRFLNQTGSRTPTQSHDLSFICVPIRLDGKPVGTLSVPDSYAAQSGGESALHLAAGHKYARRSEHKHKHTHISIA